MVEEYKMSETLGAFPSKYLKTGPDCKYRNHGVILRGLHGDDDQAFARIVRHVDEWHSKEHDVPILEDSKGKYINVFGGVIYRFDDVLWFD